MPPAASMTSASTSASAATPSRRVPLDKRKRTETSCDKCKSRKQKCRKEPGQDACRYCLVHNIECLTTQPRKKRLYGSVEGLGSRLAMLEALLKGLVPGADLSSMDEMRRLGTQLGIALPEPPVDEPSSEPKSSAAANDNDNASASDREGDDSLSLLPDQQGQVQYIGPASSFSFHLRLRSLVGHGGVREFVLFGRNAADHDASDGDPRTLSPPSAASTVDHSSPVGDRRQSTVAEGPSLDRLIAAYFDRINPDFPVLHEASFREAYGAWLETPDTADPAWLCSFFCVLLLARRVARITFPEDQERLWWRRVQTLLPVVIFTSSVTAVQAMMLAAVHLHNTNHRDACWNLTGTTLRIAYAIGLHQDRVSTVQAPQARELRKRLWWTLYAFEQMQVSSYDRPSAIEHPGPKISCPNERIIGMASHCPPDYTNWQNRLVVHLGSACRAPKTVKSKSNEESYVGPLSPAAGVLRDLERWRDMLPQHLRVEALDNAPSAFQRPILLLHSMYHYTVIVLCRAALLARASLLSKGGVDSPNPALIFMAESCSESGRELGRILIKLDSIGKFDAVTWWDTWYSLAAGSVLVLDLVCLTKMKISDVSESRILLSQLADLAVRQGRNPHVPGTLAKFASIIPDLHSMADSLYSAPSPVAERKIDGVINHPIEPTHSLQQHAQEVEPYPYQHSTTSGGAYMLLDTASGRFLPEHDYTSGQYSVPRLDRTMQMGFMDFTVNNINEWNWGDLGSLLGNDGVPPTHPHSHGPPGPPPHGPS